MGTYTIYGGAVDNYIEKEYLKKIIVSFKKDADPLAIILFGGFGKGEGSVEIINGKPVPFNDFDFYIVTRERLSEKELDRISHNASKAINMGGEEIAYFPESEYDRRTFFHVDVRCIPMNQLSTLMKTQRYYELKYKSIVIDGDTQVLNKIPTIMQSEIPLSE